MRTERQHKQYSIGVFAGEFGYDAGIGAEVGSPAFLNSKKLAVRVKGSINWLECSKADYDQWAKYKTVSASLVYNFMNIERCRVFAEAGPALILPDERFSKKTSYSGINVSTGLEMFVLNTTSLNMCYYFSLGIAYSKATAESLENQPRFGKGVFANGFRFYF
jgi:hypothetical protein